MDDLTKLSKNDGTRAGNKHIISVDLQNMGQGNHLQKNTASQLLYEKSQSYIHQNDGTGDTTRVRSANLKKVGKGQISQNIKISITITPMSITFSSKMIMLLPGL